MKKILLMLGMWICGFLAYAQHDVVWTNPIGVRINGNQITKIIAGITWTAGASSYQKLETNEDGWVEIIVVDNNHDLAAFGFSYSDTDPNWTSIDFGFIIGKSVFYYIQNGVNISLGPYAKGDVFRVARLSNVIQLFRNGNLVYTYSQQAPGELIVDASIRNFNSTLSAVCSFGADTGGLPEEPVSCSLPQSSLDWQNIVNSEIIGNRIQKTSESNEWDAGVFSTAFLAPNTDGCLEFQILENKKGLSVGLSLSDVDQSHTSIKYSITVGASGTYYAYDNYGSFSHAIGPYTAGDLMKIIRKEDYIYYEKNGELFYATQVDPSEALFADISFKEMGAGVENVTASFGDGNTSTPPSNHLCPSLFCDGENIGIGTPHTHGYKLAVAGDILTEKIKVATQANWPDYVFSPEYEMPTLEELELYIQENQKLPGIPSAIEAETNGIDLGDMNRLLLEKIEELTLHIIQQNKENQGQKERIETLEKQNEQIELLKKRLDELENR